MSRWLGLVYGVTCYLFFFATFLYLIGFVGNLFVPVSMDGEVRSNPWLAGLTNVGLVALFGIQHSVMARKGFKAWLSQYIPELMERSTYVLFSCLALVIMFVGWQPMGVEIWRVENQIGVAILYGLFFLGWGLVFTSSWLIGHFDLFGLRQTWLYWTGQPYTNLKFTQPVIYKHVRHPIYLGFMLAIWFTPVMTLTHLLFAGAMTIYILVGIFFEEKDLVAEHGDAYRKYRSEVPMLIPGWKAASPSRTAVRT